MTITFEISDKLLEKILSYGDILLSDLSDEDLERINMSIKSGIISRIVDEPHYAFEDFIEGVINKDI